MHGIEDRLSLGLSDDNDNDLDDDYVIEIQGYLTKWTNYIQGWQDRYVRLHHGTLSYYKYESEAEFGCRGAVSLSKAVIKPHDHDVCRFDVIVNDNIWYLRAYSAEERDHWVQTLQSCNHGNSLRRHGSLKSLGSVGSSASSTSFKRGRGLREKLHEMGTFRDILCQQVDTLQKYFDTCATAMSPSSDKRNSIAIDDLEMIDDNFEIQIPGFNDSKENSSCLQENLAIHASHAIDFRGEALTFKATTSGILETLSYCIDLMNQREELWRRRVEKEMEKRHKVEDLYKHALEKLDDLEKKPPIIFGGPDYEEGPFSSLKEEEFYDAIDAALDKQEKEEDLLLQRYKRSSEVSVVPFTLPAPSEHRLSAEVDEVVWDHIKMLKTGIGVNKTEWECLAEDGDMKVYRKLQLEEYPSTPVYRLEKEEDGVVLDPLRAVYVIKGVTAHELCHYFWDMDVRLDWDTTLEFARVVETLGSDTVIDHQQHKRVWPATTRDALFWSHIRQFRDEENNDALPLWITCNYSTEHPSCPMLKCIRIRMNVAMICQTTLESPDAQLSRDDITTKITYTADVHPGGWAPSSVLRAVYKREYPRFLKRFTQFVRDRTESKPIML